MPDNLYQRNGIWWARFKVSGVQYRRSLSTRVLGQAKKRLKAAKDEITDQVRFNIAPPTSWQAAVVSWNQHCVTDLAPSTLNRYLCSLAQLRPMLDDKTMADIDIDLVRDIAKARRGQGASTATIRRDLTAMSGVIDHAIDERWMRDNPTLAFRRKRLVEKHVPIVLPRPAAMATMLAASPPRFRDAQEFARETGMRQDEIFGLRHDQLDEAGQTVTMYGKGNKLRAIPYSKKARAIIARQPRYLRSPFVFWHGEGKRWTSPASRFGDIMRRVSQKAARAKADFEPFRFHDLRHLYAVEFLRSKRGSIYDLQGLLGHSSIKTTERYLAFLTPEEKKAAMHGVAQKAARKQRSGER